MINLSARIALAVVGIATLLIGTTSYFGQTVECLQRLKIVAESTVPVILAVAGVYQVACALIAKK